MTRSRGSAPSQRQLRVGEAVRHALTRVLGRGELRDPELAGRSITVTEVRVSPDLKAATAYVTPLGGGDLTAVVRACKRAAPFLRGRLAQELELRSVPQLSFRPDETFDQAHRIESLLTPDPDQTPDPAGDGET